VRHYWVATDALTGAVLADLPKLDAPRVRKTIGRYETASATLPLIGAPVDWERILTPGASVLWLLRDNPDDPAHGIPLWGGLITEDTLTEQDTVEFPMVTLEGYLDRRYVGDRTYTGVGQNDIVEDLVESFIAAGPNGGLPIRVQVVNGGAGTPRDRGYLDQDDKTIYSVLRDLMGVEGGPEWSIGGEWQSGPERITPVFYVGDRIGSPVTVGLAAAAVFEMPGSVTQFRRYRSYANGKGANAIKATSSGQGTDRPESQPVVTTDVLRPTFEHRFTPSTSIKETTTLDDHANSMAALIKDGTLTLELVAAGPGSPELDVDWFIGDDIGYSIGGVRSKALGGFTLDAEGYADIAGLTFDADGYVDSGPFDLDSDLYWNVPAASVETRPIVPAFPNGLEGVARAIGWELQPQGAATITPILAGGDLT